MKNKIIFIIGIIIGLMISVTVTYAAVVTIIKSSEVTYDNSKSHGSEVTVQGALDELYKKAKELSGDLGHVYKEEILNGADPVLKDPLIPVTIAADGTVKYANINSKWYSYSEKNWANAVILVKSPSKSYNVGDTILEKDINGYFVWIPRYSYKIWDLGNYTGYQDLNSLKDDQTTSKGEGAEALRRITGNARLIDIVFGSGENRNDAKIDSYYTHPAFINMNTNGLWVGKFEAGYNQMDITGGPISTDGWTTQKAQVNAITSARVIVKPNVYSWRSITVGNAFKNAYSYERSLDSHMMKNTEWGAVAYLSHSIYGIGNEININNNSSFLTGYSAAANTDQSSYQGTFGTGIDVTQAYNTPTGYLASTTGNITGVYDMSGGAWEYMAAYMDGHGQDKSGLTETELSTTYAKYFDKYLSNSSWLSYNNRILGDATGEMGPFYYYFDKDGSKRVHNAWHADSSYFVDSTYPWFDRGGGYYGGVLAGQFVFNRYTGESSSDYGFRLVLAAK